MASQDKNFDADGNPLESVQPAQDFDAKGAPLESVQQQPMQIPWEPSESDIKEMTALAESEKAAADAAIPVPVSPPAAKVPATIKPLAIPPPTPPDLAKLAEGNSDIPQEQKSPREQRMERGQQAANERRERMGKAPKFPQFKPPEPQLDVMAEFDAIAKKLGPGATGGDVRKEWERLHTEQVAAPGDEQAMVMAQRGGGVIDAINRVFDAQNKLLAKFQGMLAAHEQKLHELDGLLERSRR